MQSRFDNGEIVVCYHDGSTRKLRLRNPENWCPIEQDYDNDGLAFHSGAQPPYRVSLKTGKVSRKLAVDLNGGSVQVGGSADVNHNESPNLSIPGGAAQLLGMDIDETKRINRIVIRTLANDVVIGLLGITLEKSK